MFRAFMFFWVWNLAFFIASCSGEEMRSSPGAWAAHEPVAERVVRDAGEPVQSLMCSSEQVRVPSTGQTYVLHPFESAVEGEGVPFLPDFRFNMRVGYFALGKPGAVPALAGWVTSGVPLFVGIDWEFPDGQRHLFECGARAEGAVYDTGTEYVVCLFAGTLMWRFKEVSRAEPFESPACPYGGFATPPTHSRWGDLFRDLTLLGLESPPRGVLMSKVVYAPEFAQIMHTRLVEWSLVPYPKNCAKARFQLAANKNITDMIYSQEPLDECR